MAAIRGIASVDLGELIGSPLAAMVEAEARAAVTTAEFIEEVGFREQAGDSEEGDPELRMARFRYTKPDVNGEPAVFTVELPLLSLMAIPALQIKEATVALAARITDIRRAPTPAPRAAPAAGGPSAAAAPSRRLLDQLRARDVKLMAKPVSSSGPKSSEVRSSYDLDITIKLGQADVTVGLERLMQVLDQAVVERERPKDGD